MFSLRVVFFVVLSLAATGQTYNGYMKVDGSQDNPNISFTGYFITAKCLNGFSSNPATYPPGCEIVTTVGAFLITVGSAIPLSGPGSGYLLCQGQAYLTCTLQIFSTIDPFHPPAPVPAPNHTQGSVHKLLGGHDGPCVPTELTIVPQAATVDSVPVPFNFNAGHLGGGFCVFNSDGAVDWGDGTSSGFVTSPVPPNDNCAPTSNHRLLDNPTLSHTYSGPGPVKISAYMDASFKDNGDPGGASTGRGGSSGSWACHAQRWDVFNILPSSKHLSSSDTYCRIGTKSFACKKRVTRSSHRGKAPN